MTYLTTQRFDIAQEQVENFRQLLSKHRQCLDFFERGKGAEVSFFVTSSERNLNFLDQVWQSHLSAWMQEPIVIELKVRKSELKRVMEQASSQQVQVRVARPGVFRSVVVLQGCRAAVDSLV